MPRHHGIGPIPEPCVTTASGTVRGAFGDGVFSFKGVPYAANPAGENRFRPPRPHEWQGTLDARAYGPPAPQTAPASVTAEHFRWSSDLRPQREDCLALNIFTITLDEAARLPVMVYLHGGGFAFGSAAAPGLDGSNLARRGVVVVSLNHRLSVLGHLYLGHHDERYRESGNVAMLDIVAALTWVRTNIGQFGGDPECVTIFGQSGGGSKVGVLMAMPQARGLYHRAIAQSPSALRRVATIDDAERNTFYLLRRLGISPARLDPLHELPAAQLLSAARSAITDAGGIDNYRPVVDGRVLPGHPFDSSAPAESAQVPLLLGWCETEQRMRFSLTPELLNTDLKSACHRIASFLGVPDDQAAELVDIYRRSRPEDSPGDIMALIYGDHRYRRAVTHAAGLRTRQGAAPSYLYLLKWRTPVLGGFLRSPHMLCLPFVFGNVDLAQSFVGTASDRYPLQAAMSSAWIEFARTGRPASSDWPDWPSYSFDRRSTLIIDQTTSVIDDPAAEERQALRLCPPYVPAEVEGGRRT